MTANTSDQKIVELRQVIELRKANLGSKPKMAMRSNCIGLNGKPIHTFSLTQVVTEVSQLMVQKHFWDEANKAIGSNQPFVNEALLEDLKERGQALLWDARKTELDALEAKLLALRSTELQTKDALNEIMGTLNI